ncbi:Uu.00g023800.m01.CDS01 [Anthostomella pinea]|uniref:Uu.00g023800.m01.CDS01 n=1 Tax=Anthostomella pinea TaxID=933095 RepID=A0AAI8VU95_9PEZI|nr:Uu.00g023800.m01.CDS01 [Anthostomella pinea]
MYWSSIAGLALAASLASTVHGQQSGWQQNQVNATMCTWSALRVAVLKDTVYMDGGYIFWLPGMADGTYGSPMQDGNPLGLIYTLNFSTPFNTSTNVSLILQTLSKAPNGGAANNFAPNYYDGALLGNSDEIFLYGGLLTPLDTYSEPDGDQVLSYQASMYGPDHTFHAGFLNAKLPDGVTRYVTYGGAANAPSENKAWYFGGYRSPSWGEIYYPSTTNASVLPTNVSDTLITLDMAEQGHETWSNKTLPTGTPSRANPSVVWVPVGAQGILVVLGGVSYPNYDSPTFTSQNEAQSARDGTSYMSNIDVYDIANDVWYQQPTIAAPPPLALGCAVVVPAQDYSSYNIYYYGGYDGVHQDADFNDDVWILTLPSFMWMKISSGTAGHGRAGHQCVMPYSDQMVTIGGSISSKGGGTSCLDGGLLDVFNLTSGKWQDSYDPDSWNEYGVPEMIHLMIGGDFTGGATMTTPTPTGWAKTELASVFATTYPTSKMTTYYPYGTQGAGGASRGAASSGGGGMPSWVAPVLGTVLGLVFVTAVVVAILLYRRRKLLQNRNGGGDNPTDENQSRILSWVRGQEGKAPTVTSGDPSTFGDMESRNVTPMHALGHPGGHGQQEIKMEAQEMADTALVELMDTSPRAELGDTALTPVDIINKHTHFGDNPSTPHALSTPTNPSVFTGSRDYASSISFANNAGPLPPPPTHQERPDSPSLGGGPPRSQPGSAAGGAAQPGTPLRTPIVSGVSGISDREATHLRNISDPSVMSSSPPSTPPPAHVGGFHHQAGNPQHYNTYHNEHHNNNNSVGNLQHAGAPLSSPSPPTPTTADAPDYVSMHSAANASPLARNLTGYGGSVRSANSPLRRSVFRESTDDLGDKGHR